MRFRRRHRRNTANRSEARRNARKKIWEDPTIIEEMFNDAGWRRYQEAEDHSAPSKKMAQHIESEIDRDERRALRREIRLRRTNRTMQVGIAAALLLFISFQLWQQSQRVAQPDALHYAQQDSARVAVPRWVSIYNDSDQIDTVHLPDQSTVHLFAQSSLRYRNDFAVAARDIYLEGKGFFDVAKDTKRPFSVYAGATKTTALGTSFTIDTRREKQHTAVELHTGKIVVASTADIPAFENVFLDRKGASLLLDANMQIVQPEREQKEKPARLAETAAPTTTGSQLYMENIPLPDVFATLEEAYQTDIHIQDEHIRTIQYTGIIDPEKETLADVLTVICLINDLHYDTHEDGSFHIYFRKR
ncbi:FecR family protein [Sphingobacterium arenae]|uniref:FecR family protein n=1 Tax=Sphingobacterium arenae TaxID=1280598 RepID=A0ABR7Y4A4_9SPHI|nr:FecR family protein [Sphingobacterium arenae]MBD1426154.1 FecR family protein [Sphingobacterium arenae]